MSARSTAVATLAACCAVAIWGSAGCGSDETGAGAGGAAPEGAGTAAEPDAYPNGIMLALAQFVQKEGKPVPGPARVEFVFRKDGAWHATAIEDPESNVFHKAMVYRGNGAPSVLTTAGTAAAVKTWHGGKQGLEPRTQWERDFGGKWSRMREAEIADVYGDGRQDIVVATHDQGVVAVLRPVADGGFTVVEIDRQPSTWVHEIEIGDLDADGTLEVYATPSEPNRLDATPQSGAVVRYVPAREEGRTVVADLGERHAKEILVEDVDGDGRDELYVAVEGRVGKDKQLLDPVEIRRYDADTPPGEGLVIATLDDHLLRFLTAGDVEGDGKKEMVAAAMSSGVWLLRPGAAVGDSWQLELVDADSGGFEHASILTDLDGDGADELYVASDRHKQLRRYRWNGERLERATIYVRPDDRPVFTWNLMPVPVELIPDS